jgi:hypothetical protein
MTGCPNFVSEKDNGVRDIYKWCSQERTAGREGFRRFGIWF